MKDTWASNRTTVGIARLAGAYVADSQFEKAHEIVNRGNKSAIYYVVHLDFEKAERHSDSKPLLQKVISSYGDGTLTKSLNELEARLASLP